MRGRRRLLKKRPCRDDNMKQRIVYILKHNMVIQKIYIVIMSFVFQLLGHLIKTDDNIVF